MVAIEIADWPRHEHDCRKGREEDAAEGDGRLHDGAAGHGVGANDESCNC